MKRPTVEQVELVLQSAGGSLNTEELLDALREDGFDVDRHWFWSEMARHLLDGFSVEPVSKVQ